MESIADERKRLVAVLLEEKGLLLPGVEADLLVQDASLAEDDERWEGLDEGANADFAEALEAYVAVCADARCDKRFTQAWQRHANASFAEALMELVATYRSCRPSSASPAASPKLRSPAGNGALQALTTKSAALDLPDSPESHDSYLDNGVAASTAASGSEDAAAQAAAADAAAAEAAAEAAAAEAAAEAAAAAAAAAGRGGRGSRGGGGRSGRGTGGS